MNASHITSPNRVSHADKSGIGVLTGLSINAANVLTAAIFQPTAFTKAMVIADFKPTHTSAQMRQHYAERDAWEKLVSAGYLINAGRRWEVNIEKARNILPLAVEYAELRAGK